MTATETARIGPRSQLTLSTMQPRAYGRNFGMKALEVFEAEPAAVSGFLETALANATRAGAARGCLIGLATLSSFATIEGVAETVLNSNGEMHWAKR